MTRRTDSWRAPRASAALVAVAALATLAGCGSMRRDDAGGPPTGDRMAQASMNPTQGNNARGNVVFRNADDGVVVYVTLTGLTPGRQHGFHIHEKGDCSDPKAESAGGHFNPTGQPHGPQSAPHHAGDLPGLVADPRGDIKARFHVKGLTIGQGAADIVGRGLIVHADPDDYATQPTGNSGARISCGVIQRGQ